MLGKVLNSPPLDAKYNMSIMRTCNKGRNGAKVKGEKWNNMGKVDLLVKRLGSENTSTTNAKITTSQHNCKLSNNPKKTSKEESNKLIATVPR